MNVVGACILLVLAAALEASGDALVRVGIHSSSLGTCISLLAAGAIVLFMYGVTVNAPPWGFGKLLGVYVTLFFVFAQIINVVFFRTRPDLPMFVGGAFIIAGGLIITLWRA